MTIHKSGHRTVGVTSLQLNINTKVPQTGSVFLQYCVSPHFIQILCFRGRLMYYEESAIYQCSVDYRIWYFITTLIFFFFFSRSVWQKEEWRTRFDMAYFSIMKPVFSHEVQRCTCRDAETVFKTGQINQFELSHFENLLMDGNQWSWCKRFAK